MNTPIKAHILAMNLVRRETKFLNYFSSFTKRKKRHSGSEISIFLAVFNLLRYNVEAHCLPYGRNRYVHCQWPSSPNPLSPTNHYIYNAVTLFEDYFILTFAICIDKAISVALFFGVCIKPMESTRACSCAIRRRRKCSRRSSASRRLWDRIRTKRYWRKRSKMPTM